MSELDPYTQRLLDEYGCRRLMERYGYALAQKDPDMLAQIFTEDGRYGSAVGRDAIRTQAVGFFGMMDRHEQNAMAISGINIEVDGTKAKGFVHGVAHMVVAKKDGSKQFILIDALYHLEFVREPEGWLISSMTGSDAPDRPHDGSFQVNLPLAAIDHGFSE